MSLVKSVLMSHGCPAVLEPCVDNELREFPLRMRDWLKNVLVTLYERDLDHNLLTEKQKLRVRIPFMSSWEWTTLSLRSNSQILA